MPEESGGLSDPAELDTEGLQVLSNQRSVFTNLYPHLDLDVELPHVDDLVPDQGLEEHTHQPHQPVLHVSGK